MILKEDLTSLVHLLTCGGAEELELYRSAVSVRNRTIGNAVYLRGLIEVSNICRKNCLYCGIRRSNKNLQRYELTEEEILEAALYAYEHHYGSIVLQGGERMDKSFISQTERLLKKIKQKTNNGLGITLSLGEQTRATYQRWSDAGAHRYLLRIETSDEQLYHRLHPNTPLHAFQTRLQCLEYLQQCGYKTGSGVMIGLPFQTTEHLAQDLLFLKKIGVDMVGMGPYLEHTDTPLYKYRHQLLSLEQRLRLSIHMVAVLRLLMPQINIAATTALQVLNPQGREKALLAGANVIMPNITPPGCRAYYKLYPNKPDSEEGSDTAILKLAHNVQECGCEIAFRKWGDPVATPLPATKNETAQKQPK